MPMTKNDWDRFDAMTEIEIRDAALSDPDAQPWTEAELENVENLSGVTLLRHRLCLTREEFAARYHIPVGMLADWEEARSEPDAAASAYLQVIAREPQLVQAALEPRANAA